MSSINPTAAGDEAVCEVRGQVGLITLNRPKALNALNLAMIRIIDPVLRAWADDATVRAVVIQGAGDRAFCAGGDVRAVHDAGLAWKRGEGDGALTREFFFEEYRLNRRIKTFPKPYIAIVDGITMGGGVGLSIHGSHRVTTEKTLLAMPETGIGLFPDVGASFALTRMPGELGTWLALTGTRLEAADLTYLGVGTAHVPSVAVDALVADLAAADWNVDDPSKLADDIAARHEVSVGEPTLPALRPVIDRCFGKPTVEAILEALAAEGSEWADRTAAHLKTMSPTSLKLSLAEIRRGALLDFDDCLRMEFRLSQACMRGHDFYEGIRAVLVDKDRNPRWNPASLAAVSDADIEACFAPGLVTELDFD